MASNEMRRTWLVQRLNPPRQGQMAGIAEAFSFGGCYRNGGLSPEAMDVLRPIFSFDYMGAAEFEFGAVPKALSALAQAAGKKGRGLATFSLSIPLADVAPHRSERKSKNVPTGSATVYVLCPKEWADETEARIRSLAARPHGEVKEPTHLSDVLRPAGDYTPKTCGWLELDNGWMFFTDREMWAKTCAAFGVDVEAVES